MKAIRAIEKKHKPVDAFLDQAAWETQYSTGKWNKLNDLEELPHYSVIIGYIHHLKPMSTILDVGCGEGVLFRRFRPYRCLRYVGIDIAPTAINRVSQDQGENTRFIVADAETYVPQESFDVIVFSEVLYYLADPLKTVMQYAGILKDGGIIIVSTYIRSEIARAVLRQIKSKLSLLDEVKITHGSNSWICSVFTHSRAATATNTKLI